MGSASTGWFNAGSNPTVQTNCNVTLTRNKTIVTVTWSVEMQLGSASYLGSGSLDLGCGYNGTNSYATIKEHSDYWSGGSYHSAGGSFTFTDNSTTTKTFYIGFWSSSDYFSSSGIFDTGVNCSVEGYNPVTTPTVTTSVSSRGLNSISASMTVTNNGGASIVDRYIELFTNSSCTTKVGTITGASGTFSNLTPNTTYYVRANASNGTYRGYSSVVTTSTYNKATISNAPNFNHGNTLTITYSNPSSSALQIGLFKTDGSTALASYRNCSGTSYTFTFTDAELDAIYKTYGNNSSINARVYLKTANTYTDYKQVTITLKGNQKTFRSKISGTWRRGKTYVKVSGTWRNAVVWTKVNGTWRRGI